MWFVSVCFVVIGYFVGCVGCCGFRVDCRCVVRLFCLFVVCLYWFVTWTDFRVLRLVLIDMVSWYVC